MNISVRQKSIELVGYIVSLFFLIGFAAGIWLLVGQYLPSSYTIYQVLLPEVIAICLLVYFVRLNQKKLEVVAEKTAALQESHERYQHLYNSCPVPYANINRAGEITVANNACARLLGKDRIALVGDSLLRRLTNEDQTKLSILQTNIKSGTSFSDAEMQLRCENGRVIWVSVSGFMFSQHEDMFVTLLDIDQKKKIDTTKTEFVSLAAHQLRTPISTTQWAISVLIDSLPNLTPKQTDYFSKVTNNLDRLSQLVDDFLRVSKFELGNFTVEHEHVALHEEIPSLINQQETRIREQRVHVAFAIEPSTLYFKTDLQLFRMIIGNLISNAVKYSREAGEVRVGVRIDGDDLVVTVADDGLGIPFADQPGLFKKFHRGTNVKQAKIRGNGLGLYIVKEAVSVLRGKISFDSKEGEGTTFEVRLPMF